MKTKMICQPSHRIALLLLDFPAMANGGDTPAIIISLPPEDHALSWIEGQLLTGDWWGLRDTLTHRRLSFDLSYTGFSQGTLSDAGVDSYEFGDRFDALIDLDTGKLGLREGGGLHTHHEYNFGQAPFSRGGALIPTKMAADLPLGYPEELVATSLCFSQRISESASMRALALTAT